MDQKAAEVIDLHCNQGPVACIQVRSLSSAPHMRLRQLGKTCMALSYRWVCRRSGHAFHGRFACRGRKESGGKRDGIHRREDSQVSLLPAGFGHSGGRSHGWSHGSPEPLKGLLTVPGAAEGQPPEQDPASWQPSHWAAQAQGTAVQNPGRRLRAALPHAARGCNRCAPSRHHLNCHDSHVCIETEHCCSRLWQMPANCLAVCCAALQWVCRTLGPTTSSRCSCPA